MGTPPGKLTKKYAISSSGEFYLKKLYGHNLLEKKPKCMIHNVI